MSASSVKSALDTILKFRPFAASGAITARIMPAPSIGVLAAGIRKSAFTSMRLFFRRRCGPTGPWLSTAGVSKLSMIPRCGSGRASTALRIVSCRKRYRRGEKKKRHPIVESRSGPRRIASLVETTRGGIGSFFYARQRGEITGFRGEDRIELAAKILERDDRGQFHQFLVGKMFLEALE